MIRSNLMQIFWGILVVVVDVKLERLDVLIDPVGYFLIFNALGPLGSVQENFGTAKPFALAALLVSIPATFGFNPAQLTFVLETALGICLFWLICTGILRLATAQGKVNLSASALRVRTLIVMTYVVNAFVVAVAQPTPEIGQVLAVPAVGFSLVVMALSLFLLRSASIELVPAPEHPSRTEPEASGAHA